MEFLLRGVTAITWQQLVMYAIGGLLIYLAIEKGFEPALLMPMGFGAILVNLPFSGVLDQVLQGGIPAPGIIQWLFQTLIDASEALPILLFIGIGAMIDFGPLLSNPKMMIFGAAAQFGIFFTFSLVTLLGPWFGFTLADAASIGIIGAADGPTSILVSKIFGTPYFGAIAVAAYSYMALVPIVQPFAIRLVTTRKERRIRMPYHPKDVTRRTRILFPILVTVIAGLVAPMSVALVGFLMFGNLLRECGVLNSLSQTAQNEFANIITLLLGLAAFVMDTVGGVLFAKLMNVFLPEGKKINPMIGAAGISAFPMSARVVQKMALKEDNQNHLLMHAIGANVSGQIGSVIAGGILLYLVPLFL